MVDNYSLTIPQGGKYLMDAPSGTGKSTLMRTLLGLESFEAGTVEVNGQLLDRRGVRRIRHQIAYLSQDIELAGSRTVRDLVREVLSYEANQHLTPETGTLASMLAEWELPDGVEDSLVADLSGGERQRLGLAVLEYLNRPVWLLDEPTAALDEERATMAARRILDNPERTVLVISHDRFWKDLKLDGVLGIPEPGAAS